MTHTYLLIAAYWSLAWLAAPPPTERTSSHPRKIFDADCTTSDVVNSGSLNRISPNLYKVYRNDCLLLFWNQNCDLPIHLEAPMWLMKIIVKLRANRAKIARFNNVNSEITEQKFTKFWHDVAWLLSLNLWKWIYDRPILCRMLKQRAKVIPVTFANIAH